MAFSCACAPVHYTDWSVVRRGYVKGIGPMTPTRTWAHPPPGSLALADDEVHVWRAVLDDPALDAAAVYHTLGADERERAERFFFARDRARFIVARGVLRLILGRYLAVEPGELRFAYNAYGKPALTGGADAQQLRFNLSHSQGLALYALARSCEVGIDLEQIRADLASDLIAERYFSAQEAAMLRALPPESRLQGFFNCWTRKEAYIKARGMGLSLPLDQFTVALLPGEPARLLGVVGAPDEAARWTITALEPGDGFAAAVAVAAHGRHIRCWQWSNEMK